MVTCMKKTFDLTHPKIKPARLAETARSDVRKYVKRERRRKLPEGMDFWNFDCKFGRTEETAKAVHLAEVPKCMVSAEKTGLTSFYVEILARAAKRNKSES